VFLDFVKILTLTTGVAWGVLVIPLYIFAEPMIIWGTLGGCVLSAICFTAGFYAVCRTFHGSFRALMITVFGGMLVRLAVIGTIFAFVVTMTSLHVTSFLFSLLGFYVLYMIIELYFVKNRFQSWEES
jgi:hypothetical protein